MKIALLLLASILAIASIVPLMRHEAWWIRVFDFPRAQILALALSVLALSLLYWEPSSWAGAMVFGASVLAVVIQASSIFPYTRLARNEVLSAPAGDAASAVSLLIANILVSNRRTDLLLGMIAKYRPDVVLLLEPDAWWEAQMRVLEAQGYGQSVKEPSENKYGMLLYSRLPLIQPETKYLLRDGVPSMHTQVQLRSGARVWLHAVHPEPPSPTEADSSLPRDAELLIVGRSVKGRDTPTIVAGDLNDVAWSYTTRLFQKISGLLDPRKGRGMYNTFHAQIPLMRWPLDHVFHSEHFLLAELRRLPAFGSDHFPVYVRLVLQAGADEVQEAPTPNQEDVEAAKSKVSRAKRET